MPYNQPEVRDYGDLTTMTRSMWAAASGLQFAQMSALSPPVLSPGGPEVPEMTPQQGQGDVVVSSAPPAQAEVVTAEAPAPAAPPAAAAPPDVAEVPGGEGAAPGGAGAPVAGVAGAQAAPEGELPFTGFAAMVVGAAGSVATAAGLALRRMTGQGRRSRSPDPPNG